MAYLTNGSHEDLLNEINSIVSITDTSTDLDEFIDSIVEDVIEVKLITEEPEKRMACRSVANALNEIIEAFNFPSEFTNKEKLADLKRVKGSIYNLSIYNLNHIGVENELVHEEGSIHREWAKKSDCYVGVIPYIG